MTFQELRLAEPIVRAVADEGYARPTPIQMQAIPHVLVGRDLLACAQTGTGKTAAFALPILHRLMMNDANSRPPHSPRPSHSPRPHGSPRKNGHRINGGRARALVLCPTRELGVQIGESFRTYGKHLPLKHATIFGGVNQNPQVKALRAGVDVIIATPGRLLDLMQQGHVDLSAIEVFVLDEADRMLDMGFLPDIRKVAAQVPRERQTLLFSATMPMDIRSLAASMMREPVNVQVERASSTVRTISQRVYHVPKRSKPALLQHILTGEASGRTLVFTRTKHGADRVVKELLRAGIHAAAIHGNKSQNARTRAMASFKSNTPPVLVATDIASRGIDVDEITHVINFDLPNEPETYVHRIGRTARAGASGAAISFCDPDERNYLRAIERLTGERVREERSDLPELAEAAAQRNGNGHRAAESANGAKRSAAPAARRGANWSSPQRMRKKPLDRGRASGKPRRSEAQGLESTGQARSGSTSSSSSSSNSSSASRSSRSSRVNRSSRAKGAGGKVTARPNRRNKRARHGAGASSKRRGHRSAAS